MTTQLSRKIARFERQMEDFDSFSHRSSNRQPSWPKWWSSASDENDPVNHRPKFWTNTVKPSESWKTTSLAKKVLGERNGSEDIDGSVETVKPRFKNYLTPRPKFLRYRPDRRSEIFTLLHDKEDEKEIGCMNNLGQSFSDEIEKYSDGESKEEEEGEEEEVGTYGVKGLIKKLAWVVLFLFSASYLYHIDVSEVPAEGFDSFEDGFSWPIHNFTDQAASENKGADLDSLYGEHSFLSGESECDYGNEATLGKIEEEIFLSFWDDHRSPEFKELSHAVIQDSLFADDNQENTALLDDADKVRLKSEGENELSAFDSPTAVNSHFELGDITDEKFTKSKEYPTLAELETPKAQDRKIASVFGTIIFSLSILFLIALSLFLGMLEKCRSSPNIFQSQATEIFESQPVDHNSCNADLQPRKEYQTVPRNSTEATSAVYPKDVKNISLAPGVELLGEFRFRGHRSSPRSNTVTKLHNTKDQQSINFIKFPSPGSSTFAKIEGKMLVDKGTNGSSRTTPTPLRRSSRLCNWEVVQSP